MVVKKKKKIKNLVYLFKSKIIGNNKTMQFSYVGISVCVKSHKFWRMMSVALSC